MVEPKNKKQNQNGQFGYFPNIHQEVLFPEYEDGIWAGYSTDSEKIIGIYSGIDQKKGRVIFSSHVSSVGDLLKIVDKEAHILFNGKLVRRPYCDEDVESIVEMNNSKVLSQIPGNKGDSSVEPIDTLEKYYSEYPQDRSFDLFD